MYTVEFEHDEITITVIDELANHGDLKIHAFDDIVYLSQWDPETETHQIIEINPMMWEDLIAAIHSPEGFFVSKSK